MFGYGDGEAVKLVVPTLTSDGREVPAGWIGKIMMFSTSLYEAQQTGVYEVSLGEEYEKDGQYWPLLRLPSSYIERASEERRPGELRQGDRVRLLTEVRGESNSYEVGDVCTVLNTRCKGDGIFHDILPDYGEVLLAVSRDRLEQIPGCSAKVIYTVHGKNLNISWNETSFNYGQDT